MNTVEIIDMDKICSYVFFRNK